MFFPRLDRAIRIPEPIAEISWAMGSPLDLLGLYVTIENTTPLTIA